MSIGWVMFWKCIVIAVWLALVERWNDSKERHRANGLSLRQNPATGVYEVHCPYAKAERLARRALWIVGVPFGLYAALALYLVLTA